MIKYICESNQNLKNNLDYLQNNGYNFIVKATDNIMSDWGEAREKKHIHLVACSTSTELNAIMADMAKDNSLTYITYYNINERGAINKTVKGKSYTVRNDWTRAFDSEEEKDTYMKRGVNNE